MNILDQLKQAFRKGDSLTRLIFINAGVYLVLQIAVIVLRLFNVDGDFISAYLAVPASITDVLAMPWTLITYMFLHMQFFHILFNLLTLYWFGKIFLMYFNSRQLTGLYLIGGLAGALFYILSFNIFPYFEPYVGSTVLMGASASILAIVLAAALQAPNMEMRLLFLGNVKLKYIAILFVLISFFGITSNNAGGEIAHLGGALAGYIFIVSLRRGKDITRWINAIIDFFVNLFKPRKLRVKVNKSGKSRTNTKMSDAEFNMNKARRMEEIDRILDKIKTSGYESLTADEKKKLFDQGKN
ncbi:MAG: Rhomboid family protein [Bacteroidetes bacterium]|jgi:membrane associated rhomboid family serine protease|nr:Rhomboid family protein [Bacteroidota bacterium]